MLQAIKCSKHPKPRGDYPTTDNLVDRPVGDLGELVASTAEEENRMVSSIFVDVRYIGAI